MVVLIVLLIVFGPQKLPEIGQQLGRALRELKRATSEFSSSLNLDDRHDSSYNPPRYDSYGNRYDDYSHASAPPEADSWQPPAPETKARAALNAPEPPRGDFAAAALADASADYGVGLSPAAPEPSAPAAREITPRPAEGTVPRQG
jgi:TatA/E family protein of Tat protein translocase